MITGKPLSIVQTSVDWLKISAIEWHARTHRIDFFHFYALFAIMFSPVTWIT